jgi:hypothetical protein
MLSSIWKKNLICVGIAALAGASVPTYALPGYSITDLGALG